MASCYPNMSVIFSCIYTKSLTRKLPATSTYPLLLNFTARLYGDARTPEFPLLPLKLTVVKINFPRLSSVQKSQLQLMYIIGAASRVRFRTCTQPAYNLHTHRHTHTYTCIHICIHICILYAYFMMRASNSYGKKTDTEYSRCGEQDDRFSSYLLHKWKVVGSRSLIVRHGIQSKIISLCVDPCSSPPFFSSLSSP